MPLMKTFYVYIHLGKYLLILPHRYMHHLMFVFILDLKNVQTINKWKTQDYCTIIKKQLTNGKPKIIVQMENPRLLYNNKKII